MSAELVTACLIVRDEEPTLPGCLDTLAQCVDDILVVDTGSSDNTVPVAKARRARVLEFDWIDDFAAARNFALSHCVTEWCLYIDADERLRTPSRQPVRTLLNKRWMAADILLQPKSDYTRYRLTRLFRVDSRIRFEGAIHETILPSLSRLVDDENASNFIGLTAIEIDHTGYDGNLAEKHRRNLPLLQRCVGEFPERVYYWFHLTETLASLARHDEAETAGLKGVAVARRATSAKDRVDGAMICQMLAAHALRQNIDPLALIETGLELHPENFGLLITLARRELMFGDLEFSLQISGALLSLNPDTIKPELVAFDRKIFGRHAIELKVACLAKMGRSKEAAEVLAANADLLAPSRGMPPRRTDKS